MLTLAARKPGLPGPDLLLVHPPSRKRIYQGLANDLAAIEPPVWAGLMASYARTHGVSVELLDGEALGLDHEGTAREALARKAGLVAVVVYGQQPSASTQVMPGARAVCSEMKALEPDCKVLLLGGHVAALPERTLREEPVDFVAGGEGLVTLVELAQALRAGETDLSKVADLYWRGPEGPMAPTRRAPLVEALDVDMPGLAWDLLPMANYRAHNWHCMGRVDGTGALDRQPYAALYTTLGCPYRCTFCCIHAPFKSGEAVKGMKAESNSYRRWSPVQVVDQLAMLAERHGVKNVKIADEMFVLHRAHVEGICDLILERGLDLNLWAYARLDTVQEDLLDKMVRAGFRWLAFGIESANPRVREGVQKGYDQAVIYRVMDQLRAAGIHVIGNYIFGLPEDDLQSMQETLDLARELQCEFANFYCAMAYPGSPLYREALAKGWALPQDWSGFSQHAVDTLPLPTKHLSGGQVLRFRDEAFQAYYTDPSYLARIGSLFGDETVRHLQDMTRHTLQRNAY